MAKKCLITGKKSIVGGGYSNRTRATQFNPTGKRLRKPNLQKKIENLEFFITKQKNELRQDIDRYNNIVDKMKLGQLLTEIVPSYEQVDMEFLDKFIETIPTSKDNKYIRPRLPGTLHFDNKEIKTIK